MGLGIYYVGSALVGSIPFSLLLGYLHGIDLRTIGSGNPGATNLARSVGLSWGVVAFLFDAGKGCGPILVGMSLWPDRHWAVLGGGVLAVLGHCYSPFLRFRGGKGVATSVGVLLALDLVLGSTLMGVWAILVALLRNVGVASTLAAMVAGGMGAWRLAQPELPVAERPLATLLVVLAPIIVVRHRKNIADFLRRSEAEMEP